jgi:hypothetical protein
MAALITADREALAAKVMKELSRRRVNTGAVSPSEVVDVVGSMDDALDTAETTSITSLPLGTARTWLTNNQSEARKIITLVEQRRSEVF